MYSKTQDRPDWFFSMINKIFGFRRFGQLSVLTLFLVAFTGVSSQVSGVDTEESDSLYGNYLAGRFAYYNSDVDVAIKYFSRALEKDPDNRLLIEHSFLLDLQAGRWDTASKSAREIIKREPKHNIARLFLGVVSFKEKNYAEARKHFSIVEEDARKLFAIVGKTYFLQLATELALAWTAVADNKQSLALKILAKKKKGVRETAYRSYHRALIADLINKPAIAAAEYRQLQKHGPTVRLLNAYSRHLANQKKFAEAAKLLKKYADKPSIYPTTAELYQQIVKKEKVGLHAATPEMGLAEVFYRNSLYLTRQPGQIELAQSFMKLALYLHPDFDDGNTTLAQIYVMAKKHKEAIETYDRIKTNSPVWLQVQINKAFSYNALKEVDRAKTILKGIAKDNPKEIAPIIALGRVLLNHKDYKEAAVYYTKALELIKKPLREHWVYYFRRGIAYERTNQWDLAEKDLLQALKLNPDEPDVMNYLGYSWVDQNKNLDQAIDLIKKAVSKRPRSGEIVDSLGWAYYRLKVFDKAVQALEKAVILKPDDPVINDHLGDAYWKVGRKMEAGFQWNLALTLKPEPKVEADIKRKIKEGLDKSDHTNAAQLNNTEKKETVKK